MGLAIQLYFYMPWLWGISKKVVSYFGGNPENEILVTIAFFLIDSIKDTIVGIPFSLYNTFVIEQRYVHHQTLRLF